MKTREQLEREVESLHLLVDKLKCGLTRALNHIAAENDKRRALEQK